MMYRGKLATVGAAVILLAACGGAAGPSSAPASVAAPASSAAAPKPASAAPASAKPSAAASSAAAKPAGEASAKPAASVGGSAAAIALPKPEVTSFKIGEASHEAHSYPPQFALEQGIYKKYGFTGDVSSIYFDGDAKARQAILAGQVEVMAGSPSSAILTQNTDAPLVTIGMYLDHPTDDLVSIASVKNVADLKGKKVAVSSFGGDSHASVILALKALGVSDKDVTVVPIGGESARIAALASGTVAAAPIDEVQQPKMKQQGYNILIHLPDAPVTLARTGVLVRKDWAAKNPNAVLAILGAQLEALQLEIAQKDKPEVVAAYAKWIGAKDNASAQTELNSFPEVALRSMRWKPEAFENLKEVMVNADPKIASVDVTKAYDYQYLDKLHAMGFDKAVGVPGA